MQSSSDSAVVCQFASRETRWGRGKEQPYCWTLTTFPFPSMRLELRRQLGCEWEAILNPAIYPCSHAPSLMILPYYIQDLIFFYHGSNDAVWVTWYRSRRDVTVWFLWLHLFAAYDWETWEFSQQLPCLWKYRDNEKNCFDSSGSGVCWGHIQAINFSQVQAPQHVIAFRSARLPYDLHLHNEGKTTPHRGI